jgi:hypothetical protein
MRITAVIIGFAALCMVSSASAQTKPALKRRVSPPARTITIPSGTLTISAVEVADWFPPGCDKPSPAPDCSRAMPGHKILVVWLKVKGDSSEIGHELMNLQDVYVESDDGERTENFSGGMMNLRYFVAFAPLQESKNFVLHWGKNAPVRLGK